jgi:hypothetical protein
MAIHYMFKPHTSFVYIFCLRIVWLYILIPLLSHSCLHGPILLLKKSGSHYTLYTISHIIGTRKQGWDSDEMEVYNQTFLVLFIELYTNIQINASLSI